MVSTRDPHRPCTALPRSTFERRRRRVAEQLDDAVLVLPGAPVRYRSRDTEYPHRPDSELYYVTGVREPGAVAVLRGGADGGELTLFVEPTDSRAELWTGPRPGPDGVRERFGADAAYALSELGTRLPALLAEAPEVYFRLGEHPVAEPLVIAAMRTARDRGARKGVGPFAIVDPGRVLDELRLRKDPDELERMRRAAAITEVGFRALAERIAPGVGEWELQAVLEGTFRALGGDGPAFETIVASGPNACVLHYVDYERRLAEGELVLVDAGAACGLMAADMTRTFPVSGRFEGPARDLYEVVEAARAGACAAVAPGATVADVHAASVGALTRGLLDLGLIAGTLDEALEEERHKPFFPHQTSHWLGLDVHDVGDYASDGGSVVLEPNMVLTIEPGLYMGTAAVAALPPDAASERWAGIGIRLEDDMLVTVAGAERLTGGLPTEPDAVAALVGG
jgi:Xaa-Pro aminopeptidase